MERDQPPHRTEDSVTPPCLAPLIIRADAGEKMGSGHFMRCLALAQAWQDAGGRVFHVGVTLPLSLAARRTRGHMNAVILNEEPGSSDDAARTAGIARMCGAGWLVIDGYHFGADYQCAVAGSGARTLVIDDFGTVGEYSADVILDQNLGTSENAYAQRPAATSLVLGPRFALLRREFARWHDWPREIPAEGRRVLVTLGGSDPENATLKVIEALRQVKVDGLEAVIVAGGGNPHREQLAAAVNAAGRGFRLVIDADNLDELMAEADLAVAAGGSTSWERALLGLPGLVVVLAENQRGIARALGEAECAHDLGWARDLSAPQLAEQITAALHDGAWRARAAERSRALVDGRGAERVVHALTQTEPVCA